MKKVHLLWLSLALLFSSCSATDEVNSLEESNTTTIIASNSSKLETAQDLDVLLNQIGDSRFVLLGEASHGTKEYYTWRAELTKRLIKEKGFSFVAVEGDWPELYRLNQYIKGSNQHGGSGQAVLEDLNRWPTWMWANNEVVELADWMRQHNSSLPDKDKAGFYGMDVYSLWESLDVVEAYLQQNNPALVAQVRDVKACLAPYNQDEQAYGYAVNYKGAGCADKLASLLKAVQTHVAQQGTPTEADFAAEQSALTAVNAEKYYREMYASDVSSWNLRDRHMMETVNRLMNFYGPSSKVIVWAHNTHVGDARATNMRQYGMLNIGQLVREQHSEKGVYSIGFGSYTGTVTAATKWGSPAQVMGVPNAQGNSWEALLHKVQPIDKVVLLDNLKEEKAFKKMIGHRAIGVVYQPGSESGNYVPSRMPERYNAFIFIDETEALAPIATQTAMEIAR
ncbi:erythromycin esterase family protein [Pontibacter sp. KCTC 32443]|uniref:erythromycin esterase family protein n=1 Tax=Pontibacter TaxID=323449 RepID=UPI00164EC645|nr:MULTISPECIES: erythromycin esterase family protein [Pontibacter]MBC5772502.1 erythromycin esterase family protein [Pontibacter sp. KCTC 32443]